MQFVHVDVIQCNYFPTNQYGSCILAFRIFILILCEGNCVVTLKMSMDDDFITINMLLLSKHDLLNITTQCLTL